MPNIRPVFAFDTGESIIYGYWEPGDDPETVAAELMRLANASDDWSIPMQEAKMAAIHDTEHHFDTQTDPEGDPWEQLNEDYLEDKLEKGFPPDILIRTGDMKDIATSETSWEVTERTIMFHAERLPFYSSYHQADRSFPKEKVWDNEANRGKGGMVGFPRREFIGISDECADEIELIFRRWLDGLVVKYIEPPRGPSPPGGLVQTTRGFFGTLTNVSAFGGGFLVRGAGGRFVPGTFR